MCQVVVGRVLLIDKHLHSPYLVVALALVTSVFNLRNRAEGVKVIDFVAEIKIAWPSRNFRDHNKILGPSPRTSLKSLALTCLA